MMDYNKILKYLYSLESSKIKLGLANIKSLLNDIGNPESQLNCIHVAGTNGKGSVCSMLFYILKEAGYKVGLYTSPHLKKFNERIRIDDHLISNREIVEYFLKIKPYIKNQSFFEITTAIAFLHFNEKNVDFVVLEVGLGGRLDATNVVNSIISVITNIELEHTDILGNTIGKVAFEKAGIIKNNVPLVTGAKGKALEVIKKIAQDRDSHLYLTKKFVDASFEYLNGGFQQENKNIALTAINVLRKYYSLRINDEQIKDGINKTQWQGRFEFISKNVLVDCAHNPAGFETLKRELTIIKRQSKIKNYIFVIGIQNDKDIATMLKIIKSLYSTIIFTKSNNEKATKTQELLKIFNIINQNKKIIIKIINTPRNALKYAKKISSKNDLVVVTGSIYLVGEVA